MMKSKVHGGPVRQLQFDATKVISHIAAPPRLDPLATMKRVGLPNAFRTRRDSKPNALPPLGGFGEGNRR